MTSTAGRPIRDRQDLARFEAVTPPEGGGIWRSVLDVFAAAASRRPDVTAITMLMTGALDEVPRRVSHRELYGLILRAANAFHALAGPRPGVAYLLPSLVETHVTLGGAQAAGTAVPITVLLDAEHVADLVRAAGARVLVALGPHPALDIWPRALAVRDLVPGLRLVRVGPAGEADQRDDEVVDLAAALAAAPDDHLVFGEPGRDDDVAAYFHTGGTTGAPRLVTLTHRGQLAAALGGVVLGDLRDTDVLTATLPLFHLGGTVFCGLSASLAGTQLVVMSPGGLRNPQVVANFWRLVERHRATLVGGVPTGVAAVLDVPVDGADLSTVRAGICGAAACPPAVRQRFEQVTGRRLFEVYGMTEASGVIAVDPLAGNGSVGPDGGGSVGLPVPYTEVLVRRLDPDGGLGEPCGPGEVGVVTVRGPTVSPGYRAVDHDAGVFDGGLLNTGDLGWTDDRGHLHLAGRVKDLIIRSGHNIDPLMIENALAAHPAVALAAAVGMPDAYAGELPVCYVQLRPGAEVTEEELHRHAAAAIGERPAWPRRIHVLDAVPLTPVGKVFKPPLRCDAAVRAVTAVVHDTLGLPQGLIEATAGGRRGLVVTVTLPEPDGPTADRWIEQVRGALAPFLFETVVRVAAEVA
jgi:fatty-acyl-CoA synthase